MKIGTIKADTPEAQPHVIPEIEETPKSVIIVGGGSTHHYETRSSNKIFNYMTTFNNAPKMFPLEATEK